MHKRRKHHRPINEIERFPMLIQRYLTRDVLVHAGAVTLVLFLVVFSGRFINYLAEAAIGDISPAILFPVMLYKLPSFLELILPLGFFLGILLSFGRLYAESEMIIFRASGIGSGQLAMTILPAIVAVTGVVAVMSLYLGPLGSAKANALLAEPRSAEGMHVLAEGRFKKQRGGDYVTYVERVDETGALTTIFIAELNRDGAGRGVISTLARSGQIAVDDATGRRYLVLENGTRYELYADSAALTESRFRRYRELIPELEGGIRSQSKSEALPTSTLWSSETHEHRAVLAWRLSLPIIIPILAALAIPLSRTDTRRGRYAKLGPALIAFLVYFVALSQARSTTESDGSVINFLLVHTIFAVISVLALTHEDWWQRARRSNGDA